MGNNKNSVVKDTGEHMCKYTSESICVVIDFCFEKYTKDSRLEIFS